MLNNVTNRQVLSADGQVLFRQVIINGVPCWQASTGRTFPQVAGAEDPPPANNNDESADDAEQDSADAYDKDRGFRKIQAQAADLKKLKAERDTLRAQAKELEALKAKQREREDADKSEAEKLREQLAAAETRRTAAEQALKDTQTRRSIERAAIKAGAADPEDVFALLKPADFETDDEGGVKNADKLVTDLLKAKPYLAAKQTNGVPGTPRSNGQATRDAGVKEAEEKLIATRQYTPFG